MDRKYYQMGGVTMGNTLEENIARNRANQQNIQNLLQQARSKAFGTSTTSTTPTPLPVMKPEAPPLTKQTQDTLQDLRQQQTASGMTGDDLIPEFDDQIQLGGGVGFVGLSGKGAGTGEKLEALEQGVAQGKPFDEIQEDFSTQQLNRLTDDLKFSSFADGREVDPGIGRNAYNNLLNFLKFDYPNIFSQLTGQETLAELDQIALDAGNFSKGGRAGFANGSKKNMKMASTLENEKLLEQLYEQFLEEGFSPEVAAEKAREEFNRRDFAGAKGGRVDKPLGPGGKKKKKKGKK